MYQGVVMSDDMEMGAITKNYGAEDAPILALQAGCDVLCYRSENAALIAIESIRKAIQEKRLDPRILKISIDRVRKVRAKMKLATETLSLQERLDRIGNAEHSDWIRNHLSPG